MTIAPGLLEILACPECKGQVELTKEEDGVICRSCGLMYPVSNDIPVMLVDKAVKVP